VAGFFYLLYMLGIAFQGFNLCLDFFLYMIEIVLQLEHDFFFTGLKHRLHFSF
jgi:hypothetical protein